LKHRFLWLNISKYTLILAQKPLFVMRITLKCSIINVIYALGIRYSSTVLYYNANPRFNIIAFSNLQLGM
ncbi:MAG: hypothetical protein ABIE43_04155, partial [Patescibacteria group bacterium]